MSESLRRLVNTGSFEVLQKKLERWRDDYLINTRDDNLIACCDIVNLNARVQNQLFRLLNIISGDSYAASDLVRARLLPWIDYSIPGTSSASLIADNIAKDRELSEIQDIYERSLRRLEDDLKDTSAENQELKTELDQTVDELSEIKRRSANDKMFTETEVNDLRTKLLSAEDEISRLRRSNVMLNDELKVFTGRRSKFMNGEVDTITDLYRYLPRASSPLDPLDVTQRVRQENLISRFNDLYTTERIEAMDTLRRYSSNHENNQRIIFAIMKEAFRSAKITFREFKSKIRSQLSVTHIGPETLEEAVQDYINRNYELYDLPGLVSDVIRALNRDVTLDLPPDISYSVIQPFIRDACKLAWSMSALAHPLDIALANDAELYDDTKCRRSYDSEYTAPLVNHHIWPCLMQGTNVIIKGEACTRRGTSLLSPRAVSPYRSPRARSRSPSPRLSPRRRSPSPILNSSGRSSPGLRTSSRSSLRSTSLSNY